LTQFLWESLFVSGRALRRSIRAVFISMAVLATFLLRTALNDREQLLKVYSFITFLLSFLSLPVLFMTGRGRSRLAERFGVWNLDYQGEIIWFHGASVGEVNGLLPLIKEARKTFPEKKILLSATSTTGLERGAAQVDFFKLLPFDCDVWLKNALKNLKISHFIFGETEVWPALLDRMTANGIPAFLVNGRVSKRSFPRYRLMSSLTAAALQKVRLIQAADEDSKQLFIALGAALERTTVSGNAKYDFTPISLSQVEKHSLIEEFFLESRPLITLGSLRPGEEEFWFPALKKAYSRGLKINVVVAPRHKEKYSFFEERLRHLTLDYKTRSSAGKSNIIFLDTMGELEKFYCISKLAFIGGTLKDYGGHNPIEAAAHGAAIVMGPFVSNIHEIVESLKSENALFQIKDEKDVFELLMNITSNNDLIEQKGNAAKKVWTNYRGATARIWQSIIRARQ